MPRSSFRVLYSDIGGVLGTNGWDTDIRLRICDKFGVDTVEAERRHRLMFDSYERGFTTFEDYLNYVFFYTERPFTLEAVREFTYAQSVPWFENMDFVRRFRTANGLKLGLISNEGAGITQHRVVKFGLRELADFMVISHFVHFRKPDPEIWKLALDLAGCTVEESIYIDDRPMFVQVARDLGFTSIHHISLETTRRDLHDLGLQTES
ncbi:MAG: HAD-IA family hydrolase [Acidobacteriaceae bacterium]|nr:HAD-IA family hydrolase [Acidobacteriaceae bacterium]MBV9444126.1 HAD-IA family hydrolase [Acidobacteriaceae bacterium]